MDPPAGCCRARSSLSAGARSAPRTYAEVRHHVDRPCLPQHRDLPPHHLQLLQNVEVLRQGLRADPGLAGYLGIRGGALLHGPHDVEIDVGLPHLVAEEVLGLFIQRAPPREEKCQVLLKPPTPVEQGGVVRHAVGDGVGHRQLGGLFGMMSAA